ncbi:MAG: hypothetical protein HY738_14470, partial [Bacteroidia bacterium]|nr:hypothetical protein [Bacteroidia bacterium]
NSLSSYEHVPVIGDLMTSRWAFEALAVEQFKDNKYQQNFFEIDREISNYGYVSNFYIPELEKRLDIVARDISINKTITASHNDFNLLTNEITQLEKLSSQPFAKPSILKAGVFKPADVAIIRNYLSGIQKSFGAKCSAANKLKDNIYSDLVKKYGSDDAVYKLKQDFYNNNLADVVLNRFEIQNLIEYNNRLIRMKDPVYEIPESKNGRAKLYSSVKYFFGAKIDTYWFNIVFIRFSSFVLDLVLYFDFLKKSLDFFGNIRLKKTIK